MFWQLEWMGAAPDSGSETRGDGPRFVLHRHRDTLGPHWDLRLEQTGYLQGWRIEGAALEGVCRAMEKQPHPVEWLTRDGDAVREDEGVYAWVSREEDGGELLLRGRAGTRRVLVRRMPSLRGETMESVRAMLQAHALDEALAGALIEDGVRARQRSVARLCGLGRELDGRGFDEALWRRSLEGLSLRDIERHLEVFETRFDGKYPPQPVSRPEALGPEEGARGDRVLEFLREQEPGRGYFE